MRVSSTGVALARETARADEERAQQRAHRTRERVSGDRRSHDEAGRRAGHRSSAFNTPNPSEARRQPRRARGANHTSDIAAGKQAALAERGAENRSGKGADASCGGEQDEEANAAEHGCYFTTPSVPACALDAWGRRGRASLRAPDAAVVVPGKDDRTDEST